MKYCIVPYNKINEINFSKVIEKKETVRCNLDNSEFIVKYNGEKPASLSEYQEMTREQIILITTNPENGWINNL
tara:strand:- start:337 stop:558 length:222 start_codon:yes stop_codon:yes gene_type:complete